ncbi:MAG: hypothetical protein JAY84_08920 [Candidatus Thiodiazotropha taylori]|nr:hypothetical protein [Candidatus Thiodiazotropha taylori]
MTTALDIVDTAVKIGLGALISGFATYFVTKRNNTHEIFKEQHLRRLDLLEKLSISIQSATTGIHKAVHAYLENVDSSEEVIRESLKESLDEYLDVFNQLNLVDGYASLLGNEALNECLVELNDAAMDLYYFFLNFNRENADAYNEIIYRLNKARESLPEALSRVYTEHPNK